MRFEISYSIHPLVFLYSSVPKLVSGSTTIGMQYISADLPLVQSSSDTEVTKQNEVCSFFCSNLLK